MTDVSLPAFPMKRMTFFAKPAQLRLDDHVRTSIFKSHHGFLNKILSICVRSHEGRILTQTTLKTIENKV